MKLIVAIVQKEDAKALRQQLIDKGFRVTQLATRGGFLYAENATLLIGVEEQCCEEVFAIIKDTCRERSQLVLPQATSFFNSEPNMGLPIEVKIGGATVFVIDVEEFIKM